MMQVCQLFGIVFGNILMQCVQAVDALRSNDIGLFGKLMYESHASLRDDYEVRATYAFFFLLEEQNWLRNAS